MNHWRTTRIGQPVPVVVDAIRNLSAFLLHLVSQVAAQFDETGEVPEEVIR